MPDRAVLTVTVEGEGAARDEAYETAARSAKAVDDVIDRLGDAVERVTHTALVVHPKTRWRKGETVRAGWRASRSTSLEVVDLAHLGDLIAEVAMSGGEISGPNWQIDADNPAYMLARRAAAQDARTRAQDYAEALGLELGTVRWVAEPGLRRGEYAGPVGGPVAYAAAAMSPASDDREVIDVSPGEMTVRLAVEVGFAWGAG